MQQLPTKLLAEIKGMRVKKLEKQFEHLRNFNNGDKVSCPFCGSGEGRKRKYNFVAKVFENPNGKCFKCFSCGIWRRL